MAASTLLPFAIHLYGPGGGALPSRFEEVAARLEAIERLHFEWDGSFVWRSAAGEAAWQLDGMIYDLAERIQYVDLKGCCPRGVWRELLEILAGEGSDEFLILRLPHREKWNRLRFEEEIWGKPSPPDRLA